MRFDFAAVREGLKALGRRLLVPGVIFAAVVLLQVAASFAPRLVEQYYSRGLYPRILRAASLPGRLAGFSVAELFLSLLLVALAAWLAWHIHRLVRRRQSVRGLLASAFVRACWVASVLAAVFMPLFGLNYLRPPLAETLRLERREPDAREAEAISRAIIEGVNRNFAESGAAATADEGSRLPLTRPELFTVLEEAFAAERLLQGVSAEGGAVPPKPVYFSGLLSRLGTSGVYSPFTGEPHFNAIMPDADLPFTVAHEMAHQRGFARESEASFVAFLVCTKSSHPYVRYSGYLGALRVLSVLRRLAPERYAPVAALLGEGPRADLRAGTAFWTRYGGKLARMSRRVNNAYLRANRVRSGVRNYGEAVALVVGYYLTHGLAPQPVADSAPRSYP